MTAELQIERILEHEGEVWGVCEVNGSMILESAPSLSELKWIMWVKALLLFGVYITEFEVLDITNKIL